MPHEKFHYHSLGEVSAARELPLSEDIGALLTPVAVAGKTLPNRVALQPMEGADGTEAGAPGELTRRRYIRFASGGAALIWFEAVAIAPEARANARQLMITEENLDSFRRLVDEIRETGLRVNGFAPLLIMQATHSGRYAKPHGVPEPLIAYNCPPLEDAPIDRARVLSDDALARCGAAYGRTAKLARLAGFDGMDIKCCHRYLASELLSAYERPGAYGGCFEHRVRFAKDAYRAARAETDGGFFLTSRLNAYDGFAYPYGFGVAKEGLTPDYAEPIRLVRELREEFGIPLINITMGNPYKNPHVNRPYDAGGYVPDEHPLDGVARMMDGVAAVQRACPDVPVLGSAFSYLRAFAPNLAAGMIGRGLCALAGFGRMAFAYPDFVRDLRERGALDGKKVCVACGGCAKSLRAGGPAGCVVRDKEAYGL